MYIIKEAKQVGILYHYTSIPAILLIVKDMKLKDYTFDRGYISFTRSGINIKGQGRNYARLVLDGDKLSNKYSVVADSQALAGGVRGLVKPHNELQSEERIYKKEIDITPYLISIDIIKGYAKIDLSKDELAFLQAKTKVNLVDSFQPYRG